VSTDRVTSHQLSVAGLLIDAVRGLPLWKVGDKSRSHVCP